jgi:hypothetical protein
MPWVVLVVVKIVVVVEFNLLKTLVETVKPRVGLM